MGTAAIAKDFISEETGNSINLRLFAIQGQGIIYR